MADTNSGPESADNMTDVAAAGSPTVTFQDGSASHEADGREASKPSIRQAPKEIGGRDGPEPTRFGDWEKAGRCIDF
jgi:hypothetical protein